MYLDSVPNGGDIKNAGRKVPLPVLLDFPDHMGVADHQSVNMALKAQAEQWL